MYKKETRILVGIAVVLLIVICVSISSLTARTRSDIETLKTLYTEGTVARVKEELLMTADNAYSYLTSVAEAAAYFPSLDDYCFLDFIDNSSKNSVFRRIAIMQSDGAVYSSDGYNGTLGYQSVLKLADTGKFGVTKAIGSDGDDGFSYVMSVKLRGAQPEASCAVGTLCPAELSAVMQASGVSESNIVFVFDKAGDFIVRPHYDESKSVKYKKLQKFLGAVRFEKGFSKESVEADISAGSEGVTLFEYKRKEYIGVYSPCGISDWYVLAAIPRAEIADAYKNTERTNALLIALAVVSLTGLCVLFIIILTKKNDEIQRTKQNLKISEERYGIALRNTNHLVMEYDVMNGKIIYSPKAAQLYGCELIADIVPDPIIISKIVNHDDALAYRQMYKDINEGKPSAVCVIKLTDKNGDYIWNNISMTAIYDEKGRPVRAIGFMEDITTEKEAEEKSLNDQQYRDSIKKMYTYNAEWNISKDRLTEGNIGIILGGAIELDAPVTDAIYEASREKAHPEDSGSLLDYFEPERLTTAFDEGITEFDREFRLIDENSSYHWWSCHLSLFKRMDSDDLNALVLIKDIDDQRKELTMLKEKAIRDSFTGLYNKAHTQQLINELFVQSENNASHHAMMLIDIDNFKSINDTLGHTQGDRVLFDVSAALSRLFRKSDIVGRTGGDEFMICIRNIDTGKLAIEKAQAIVDMFSEYTKQFEGVTVSASIGIAEYPKDGKTFEQLYVKADKAMYLSKQQGKNRYTFYTDVR